MVKNKELFKKIRDIKGISSSKMGMIKNKNSRALTETEAIKKK